MATTEAVDMLGVGTGEERIRFHLTERALTVEMTPAQWARIEARLRRQYDDGSLMGGLVAAGSTQLLHRLKRWYLGPHDIAAIDIAFDGRVLRIHRHGLGDVVGHGANQENTWYAAMDALGGEWSEGFDPEEARAFVQRFQKLRESRLRSLGYTLGLGARVLVGTAAAAALTAAVAWTMRHPRRPGSSEQ